MSAIAIAKATTAIKTARTERAYGIQGTHKAAQSRFNRARRHNAKAVIEAALEPLEDDLSLTEQLAEANADYEWQEEAYRIEAEAIDSKSSLMLSGAPRTLSALAMPLQAFALSIPHGLKPSLSSPRKNANCWGLTSGFKLL